MEHPPHLWATCASALIVKNFFLISNLNLPSFSLRPFPLVLSQQTLLKSLSPSFLYPPLKTERPLSGLPGWSLLFSRLHSLSSLSRPWKVVFHPWDHFCGPLLVTPQQVYVSPVLRTPHLDAVLTVQRGRSPPSPCWPRCFGCCPGYGRLSGLRALCWLMPSCHPSVPSGPFWQGCAPSLHPPACTESRGLP